MATQSVPARRDAVFFRVSNMPTIPARRDGHGTHFPFCVDVFRDHLKIPFGLCPSS